MKLKKVIKCLLVVTISLLLVGGCIGCGKNTPPEGVEDNLNSETQTEKDQNVLSESNDSENNDEKANSQNEVDNSTSSDKEADQKVISKSNANEDKDEKANSQNDVNSSTVQTNTNSEEQTKIDQKVVSKSNANEDKDEKANSQNEVDNSTTSGVIDGDKIIGDADLNGDVKAFSDDGFTLIKHQTGVMEDGALYASAPVAGGDTAADWVTLKYDANSVFQILTIDKASYKALSLKDVNQDELKEGSSVVVYGKCQDTTHWTVSKVIIIIWQ